MQHPPKRLPQTQALKFFEEESVDTPKTIPTQKPDAHKQKVKNLLLIFFTTFSINLLLSLFSTQVRDNFLTHFFGSSLFAICISFLAGKYEYNDTPVSEVPKTNSQEAILLFRNQVHQKITEEDITRFFSYAKTVIDKCCNQHSLLLNKLSHIEKDSLKINTSSSYSFKVKEKSNFFINELQTIFLNIKFDTQEQVNLDNQNIPALTEILWSITTSQYDSKFLFNSDFFTISREVDIMSSYIKSLK